MDRLGELLIEKNEYDSLLEKKIKYDYLTKVILSHSRLTEKDKLDLNYSTDEAIEIFLKIYEPNLWEDFVRIEEEKNKEEF